MEAGDLLLVDAAASYQHLTGDITRSYPVSGAFSPMQRDLYELVLAAQEAAMKAAKAGNTPDDIEEASEAVIKEGLLKRGLITDVSGEQFRTWYTHGICHFIGMDVHDVGDYNRRLEPGMAFVIEPGLYIREQALNDLPKTAANSAFVDKVRAAVTKYANIGIRIEDSFLLTDTGLERLSATVATLFGALAMILALVGVFGVTSDAAVRRRPEIGVRMALGATRAGIVRLVLRRALPPIVAGIVIGAVAAAVSTRTIATQLFAIDAWDPATFIALPAAVCLLAAGFALFPAVREAAHDPLAVLRGRE